MHIHVRFNAQLLYGEMSMPISNFPHFQTSERKYTSAVAYHVHLLNVRNINRGISL